MKRGSIWIIIGLMSLAMIGMGALQIYWINWSIELGKENIENSIREALNSVAHNLEIQEKNQAKVYSGTSEQEALLHNTQLLAQRLPTPIKLQQLIDRELESNGIYTEYRYGVFSTLRNSFVIKNGNCLLYTSPSPRDLSTSRMPSSA